MLSNLVASDVLLAFGGQSQTLMDDQQLTDYLLDRPKEITNEVLDFYQQHPEELEMVTNREEIQLGILKYFFFIAVFFIGGARTTVYLLSDFEPNYFTEVVLEFIFEVGNAILGGVLAAFLIERLQKKQYEKNVRYKREVLRLLDERKAKQVKGTSD
ncbi:MAG: hypothetical protein AAGA85_01280 [Bacteroidota bacterium]